MSEVKQHRLRRVAALAAAGLIWILACVGAALLTASQPSLGGQFTVVDGSVVVNAPGQARPRKVHSLAGAGLPAIELRSGDLDPEPTYLRRYTELRAFLQRQGALAKRLGADTVELEFDNGTRIAYPLSRGRPLSELPWDFWAQLALTLIPLLLGAAAIAQRPNDRAARYYAICASGFLLMVCASAIYSTRELALDPRLFTGLLGINHFAGLVLLVGGGTALIWHYPRELSPFPADRLIFGYAVLAMLVHALQWLPSLDLGLRLPVLVFFVANLVISVRQWRRSRGRPVDRAMLRWFLLAWFIGIGSYVVLLVLPVLFGARPLTDQLGGWIALFAIYLGLGFGITRFRLFYVNRAQLLVWIGEGLLVCAIYGLGTGLLDMHGATVLWIGLAVAGWAHVPLRDRIWARFGGVHGGLRYESLLPRVLERAVDAGSASIVEQRWRETLAELFQPQSLTLACAPLHAADIADDGGSLLVPALPAGAALRLEGANRGGGVFMPADIQLADSLWTLFAQVKTYREQFGAGEQDERTRLAAELRQRIDEPLLSLSRSGVESTQTALLNEARHELQVVLLSLAAADAPLDTHVRAWQQDMRHRCEAAGLAADIDIALDGEAPALPGRIALNLRRILREAVTNAIRHARAQRIQVRLRWHAELKYFSATIDDDGTGFDPLTARAGRGLHNMRTRADELGALIDWAPAPLGGTRMHLELRLTDAVRADVLKIPT